MKISYSYYAKIKSKVKYWIEKQDKLNNREYIVKLKLTYKGEILGCPSHDK